MTEVIEKDRAKATEWLEADWMDDCEDRSYRGRAIESLAAALAQARAEGREQGLEEAAEKCEADAARIGPNMVSDVGQMIAPTLLDQARIIRALKRGTPR